MKRPRFNEEQTIGILAEQAVAKCAALCCMRGMSEGAVDIYAQFILGKRFESVSWHDGC